MAALPGRHARLALLCLAGFGCAGPRAGAAPPESAHGAAAGAEARRLAAVRAEEAAEAEARARATGPAPLDEASARLLVAAKLRAAGYRVLEDVSVRAGATDITLDGFDPIRRVGYEYVAVEERGLELDPGERARLAALAEARILVLDSGSADEIASAVDRFLSGLASTSEARDQPAR